MIRLNSYLRNLIKYKNMRSLDDLTSSGGEQYVVIPAGGHSMYGSTKGDSIMAYKLKHWAPLNVDVSCTTRALPEHSISFIIQQEDKAMWTKPAYTDLRIGFEVTMYFANR